MEMSGQLHISAALPLEKSPQSPLDRRLDGSRAGLDTAVAKIKIHVHTTNRNPAIQL